MTSSSYQAKTRLSSWDYQKLKRIAQQRKMTMTAVVREALLAWIECEQAKEKHELEGVYAQQLKASTNRICALLAKSSMDARAILYFLGEMDESGVRMETCRDRASRLLRTALTAGERAVEQAMSQNVLRPTLDPEF